MQYGELGKRIGVAAVTIPIICGITLIGKIPFLIFVDVVVAFALWELYGLAEKKGLSPSKVLGILSVLTINWDLYFYGGEGLGPIFFFIIFIILIAELFKGKANSLANCAVSIFGVLYMSLFSFFILIRELPSRVNTSYRVGGWIVIMIFGTIWICDTGAYLLGAKFGKHLLFKRVSPKKTWEGAVSGFAMGIAAATGLHYIFVPSLSVIDSIIIGIIVGVFGQLSDLIESLYKRDAGVKDSSNILPGHGGFLDRFDSPLLVGPTVYLYLVWSGFHG